MDDEDNGHCFTIDKASARQRRMRNIMRTMKGGVLDNIYAKGQSMEALEAAWETRPLDATANH